MTIALSLCLAAGSSASAAPHRSVDLLWLPARTTVAQLAALGYSPGLMSAGLGTVPPGQTFLDVGAGNRVFDSLYDEALPPPPAQPIQPACGRWFAAAVKRAATAPDEIEPGLLGRELGGRGINVGTAGESSCPLGGRNGLRHQETGQPYFESEDATLQTARLFGERVSPLKLVIAVARPTGESGEPIAIGIAGRGFHGNLTSDTTRTNGYVLSTDVAPTILEFFGLGVPDQMTGQAIRSEGSVDPGAIESLGARMAVVSHRRGPVIGLSLLAWVLAALLLVAVSRGALARVAVRLLGLSVVYLLLALLLAAALEWSQYAEMALVMVAAPAFAALTLAALHDYRALAVAAGLTVVAYALDAIAGSPLSALSLLGPNPGLGVRFYGIGNELEASLAVLIVGGIGAGLAGFFPRLSPGRCAAAFLVIGLVFAGIFASGEFGADVGAAIDFPIGVAVAAVVVTGGRARRIALVVLVPVIVLVLLALADLVTGANSHFTRSVLDAGGLHSLGDTAQRRLEQTANSFARPVLLVVLPLVAILAVVAWLRRATLAGWVRDVPAMRAALLGAVAATIVATLANDSGALLLEIGAAYLLVFLGWAWAEGGRSAPGA